MKGNDIKVCGCNMCKRGKKEACKNARKTIRRESRKQLKNIDVDFIDPIKSTRYTD